MFAKIIEKYFHSPLSVKCQFGRKSYSCGLGPRAKIREPKLPRDYILMYRVRCIKLVHVSQVK